MKAIVLLLTVAFMVAVRVGHVHGELRVLSAYDVY